MILISGFVNSVFWFDYELPFFFIRQQVFTAFTKEVLAAPFTEQIFHFVIPALADARTVFPYEPFLAALLSLEGGRSTTSGGAPWLFYFVLTVGDSYLGMKRRMSCELTQTQREWMAGRSGEHGQPSPCLAARPLGEELLGRVRLLKTVAWLASPGRCPGRIKSLI